MWKIEGPSLAMAVAQSPAGDRAKLLFAFASSLSAQTGKKECRRTKNEADRGIGSVATIHC
ncbi:MAG: hypothetical protein AAAB20_28505 [Rhizobium sp.]|uniref:hypothetical protein n=1 Tax=Rhizobium sp. TaxID=391 RepID=UPI0006478FB9